MDCRTIKLKAWDGSCCCELNTFLSVHLNKLFSPLCNRPAFSIGRTEFKPAVQRTRVNISPILPSMRGSSGDETDKNTP